MKCKNCGFENEDDVRFCSECGNPLTGKADGGGVCEKTFQEGQARPSVKRDDRHACIEGGDSGASSKKSSDNSVDELNAEKTGLDNEVSGAEKATQDDFSTEKRDPSRSVGSTNDDGSHSARHCAANTIWGKLKSLDKKIKIGVGAGAIVLILVVAVLCMVGSGPSDSQIKSDLENNTSLTIDTAYGVGDGYIIDSVDIASKKKMEDTQGLSMLGISDVYEVAVKFTASNSDAKAMGSGIMHYAKQSNKWLIVGTKLDESYTAKRGISKDRLLANADSVLRSAGGDLPSMYEAKDAKIKSVKFDKDAQTCTAEFSFEKSSTFSDAKATVTARFSFKQGAWHLDNAKISGGGGEVSYDKLVGTWTGAFSSTASNGSGKCYGGQGAAPVITIKSIDKDSLKIEGTFKGLVHYHGPLDTDSNATDGDAEMPETPFVATLGDGALIGGYSGKRYNVGADAKFPETNDGIVSISFGFGDADDPNKAVLQVMTQHSYEKGVFTLEARYADTYTLSKSK